jgi:hypothetical protein
VTAIPAAAALPLLFGWPAEFGTAKGDNGQRRWCEEKGERGVSTAVCRLFRVCCMRACRWRVGPSFLPLARESKSGRRAKRATTSSASCSKLKSIAAREPRIIPLGNVEAGMELDDVGIVLAHGTGTRGAFSTTLLAFPADPFSLQSMVGSMNLDIACASESGNQARCHCVCVFVGRNRFSATSTSTADSAESESESVIVSVRA